MASSGTIAAPAIDFRYRPQDREEEIIFGYMRVKSQAVLDAGDLDLRTIKNFSSTPYFSEDSPGGPSNVYGSVNTRGSLMNNVTITALRGSTKGGTLLGASGTPYAGTFHLGTLRQGTHQISFVAVGA